MGWGRGGRGAAGAAAPAGGHFFAAAREELASPERGGHYFAGAREESGQDDSSTSPCSRSPQVSAKEAERKKQELRVRKKLREVEDLERRRDAGEKLEVNQLKKLESKASVLQELSELCPEPKAQVALAGATPTTRAPSKSSLMSVEVPAPAVATMDQDIRQELEMLEQEAKEVQELLAEADEKAAGQSGKGKGKSAARGGRAAAAAPAVRVCRPTTGSPAAAPPAEAAAKAPVTAWADLVRPGSSEAGARACAQQPVEQRLGISDGVRLEQLRQLSMDLRMWALKFEATAEVVGLEVIATLRSSAAGREHRHVEVALSELRALVEFNVGPVVVLKEAASPASRAASPPPSHTERRRTLSFKSNSNMNLERQLAKRHTGDLSDPDTVFDCCDTDESGELDLHELRFAFNAFGLFPDLSYLEHWMDGRRSLTKPAFRQLLQQKLASAPTSMRRPRAIPYSRRGVSLEQLESLHVVFVESGWLREKCEGFNAQEVAQIKAGKVHSMTENLYALDRFVIRPVTSPEPDAGEPVADHLREDARLPLATHKCSYSELVNPDGVLVDAFVSHFWGHPFADTMLSLRKWTDQVHGKYEKKRPQDMVFWLCFLALNQHRAGEEVGSSPEDGPFNAALMQAASAVMILDEQVNPFRRIWCLFEVKRLTDLEKDFDLICSLGPVKGLLEAADGHLRLEAERCVRQIGDALEQVSAFAALASSEEDKLAIWHRVADPAVRRMPLATVRAKKLFREGIFKRFDMRIRGLLAAPLFKASLRKGDHAGAFRYIGLGAAFYGPDLDRLQALSGLDLCQLEVPVRSWGQDPVDWTLLHCAAYFGHAEAVENLVGRRAQLQATTRYGLSALHHASRNGHEELAALLLGLRAEVDTVTKDQKTALANASYQGYCEVVKALLEWRASVNGCPRNGRTPIHDAASCGHHDVVQALLEYNADPAGLSHEGMSALHCAARDGHEEVAEVLLSHSTPSAAKQALEKRTRRGHLALAVAESAGHFEVADVIRFHTQRLSASGAEAGGSPAKGCTRGKSFI